jgi:Holliday junction resolvase RusA-like endonuclease
MDLTSPRKAPAFYIQLPSFPMPPSANRNWRQARRRIIKSDEARNYEEAVSDWNLRNLRTTNTAREVMRRHLAENPKLRLHCSTVFYFQEKRILCKDGTVKCLDTSNRLKVLHDAVAHVLVIDDKLFWSGEFYKESAPLGSPEWVTITITPLNSFVEPAISSAY